MTSKIKEIIEDEIQKQTIRQLTISVLAAMETGDIDRARLLLTEVKEYYPEAVKSVKADVREVYGIVI